MVAPSGFYYASCPSKITTTPTSSLPTIKSKTDKSETDEITKDTILLSIENATDESIEVNWDFIYTDHYTPRGVGQSLSCALEPGKVKEFKIGDLRREYQSKKCNIIRINGVWTSHGYISNIRGEGIRTELPGAIRIIKRS